MYHLLFTAICYAFMNKIPMFLIKFIYICILSIFCHLLIINQIDINQNRCRWPIFFISIFYSAGFTLHACKFSSKNIEYIYHAGISLNKPTAAVGGWRTWHRKIDIMRIASGHYSSIVLQKWIFRENTLYWQFRIWIKCFKNLITFSEFASCFNQNPQIRVTDMHLQDFFINSIPLPVLCVSNKR